LFYNLDVIISVGYRVKSLRGTQFRIWATQRLREYIIKGFTLDDRRLQEDGGGAYFDELLARIRDIPFGVRGLDRAFLRRGLTRRLCFGNAGVKPPAKQSAVKPAHSKWYAPCT
jgi:hypothetical protein